MDRAALCTALLAVLSCMPYAACVAHKLLAVEGASCRIRVAVRNTAFVAAVPAAVQCG